MATQNKKYFFGWQNIKFCITELIKIFSAGASFFSKKRIESGVAFAMGQFGMLYYLLYASKDLGTMDIMGWAAVEFGIAGYIVHQIQKQKVVDNSINNQSGDDTQIIVSSDDDEPKPKTTLLND